MQDLMTVHKIDRFQKIADDVGCALLGESFPTWDYVV